MKESRETKAMFGCTGCGATRNKWFGRCPECGAWNSAQEFRQDRPTASGYAGERSAVKRLDEIAGDDAPRLTTGLHELDRVLGGGLVRGSVILVGGDPGIGKSTVLLQACCRMSEQHAVLYVSGEESLEQIALRAKRLRLPAAGLRLAAETLVENILETAREEKPAVLVVDSIQTMQSAHLQGAPGTVPQVRECAAILTRFAKQSGTAVFLVGHVTKSGDIAGPRVLEHIIDVVCSIESSPDNRYRILRSTKNRFGAVNELGVFAMTETGMKEVRNPSAIFLSGNPQAMPGCAVTVLWEGSRPLLVEIQSLVDECYAEAPRRVAMGFEPGRLVMLLAVLHKHGNLASYAKDVFVNVVGGIRVTETAADLALLMAIAASLTNRQLPEATVLFGEIGLTGEVRPVPNGQQRLQEAVKHGFRRAILPAANAPKQAVADCEVIPVHNLAEALGRLRGG
ncbi:MAG: DNA repair protein RadA [Thermodesulfobacteriota bacterium]